MLMARLVIVVCCLHQSWTQFLYLRLPSVEGMKLHPGQTKLFSCPAKDKQSLKLIQHLSSLGQKNSEYIVQAAIV